MTEREDTKTYCCEDCDNEHQFNPDVAPDEPACPACWSGWDNPFPVMRRV